LFLFKVRSWWPWRSSLGEGKCILRTQDGWLKRPCNELQAFVCERDINRQSIPLTVRCGNDRAPLSSSTIITTTTTILSTTSTRRPTVSFIQPPIVHEEIPSLISQQRVFIPSINTEQTATTIETKTNSIDPSGKKTKKSFHYITKLSF
jgi:hypothetical protein